MKPENLKLVKQFIFFGGLVLIFAACSSQKRLAKTEVNNGVEIMAEDSVEYEMETFDSKFETWYQLHKTPSQYRSQQYYEGWNQRYVNAWNQNARVPQKSWFFEPIVGYDPTIDYGFELNHELFYYFQYVERVLKIEIMPGGPRSLSF